MPPICKYCGGLLHIELRNGWYVRRCTSCAYSMCVPYKVIIHDTNGDEQDAQGTRI